MPLINVSQINGTQLALAVQQYSSGAAFSGNMVNWMNSSGWMGSTVVGVTGAQDVTGIKTFLDSPRVPYSGGTGTAPSARWVNDQIGAYSGWANGSFLTNVSLTGASGQLVTNILNASGANSYVRVTGSATIQSVNFTGLGGTLVIYSGGWVFISGAAAGAGGGSNVTVTGSSTLSTANLTGAGSVVVSYVVETGPGAPDPYVLISGSSVAGGTPDVVTTTGVYILAGNYTFSGSPFVPAPTQPSGAANLSWVSGVSGVLQAAIGSAAPVTNVYNLSGITGNFVNMSFYLDEFGLTTGLNLFEAFVGRSFFFTGYALGTITSGTQGAFSGSLYQRTPTNVKTAFVNFGMPAGQFFSGRGGFSQEISGMNRVGLDIYLIGTGLTGVSIGAFGVGY